MYVVTMKLPGIEPAGIVDAILDHGGPIANSNQSPDSVFKFRSLADEHQKCRYGSLE